MPFLGRGRLRVCVLVGAALLCSSGLGSAATVRYQTDAELIAASARVIRGRVLSTRGERGAEGRIYTVTTIAVLEDFSGYGDSIVEVRELGGTVGNEFLYVGGAVRYEPGSEIVVCLERSAAGWLRSVSMGFSKFDVVSTGDGDARLHRNMHDTVVVGNVQPEAAPRLSSFRRLSERVRGVRSVEPPRVQALDSPSVSPLIPLTVVQPFTYFGIRWTEADSGTPVRWYIDTSAAPPVPGDASSELQVALSGWTNPPQASIVLAYGGFTDQPDNSTRGPWPSLGGGAGVVFFEDPTDEVGANVLAIGGGQGSGDGGTVNGTPFTRMISGFVIFQNAAALPFNFRESRDFTRVLEHEVGHGIGLGHTQTDGSVSNPASNIMYPSCCSASTPIAPAIGPDDLAGLVFLYPGGSSAECTYTLSSSSTTVPYLASSFSVTVSTQTSCAWSVSGLPPWMSSNVTSGVGNGSVQLTVSTNTATSQRSAALSIASQPFAVTQEACPCTVSPTSGFVPARGGTLSIAVSSSFCQWAASSAVPWITVTGGAAGSGSGTVTLAVSRNTGPARNAVVSVAGQAVAVTQPDGATTSSIADFNGDGRADLVWHHQGDGRISVWHMNGISLISGTLLTPQRVADLNWKVVGVWDPDRDGNPDLLWRHESNGNLATWQLRGTTQVSGFSLTPGAVTDTGWTIVAVADMDADGDDDLIWQHRIQGLVSAWLMNGTTMVEGRLLSPSRVPDTNWRIVGAGDFDGDGQADLVWQHQVSGQASVWFMKGTTQVRGTLLSPPGVSDTNWQIRSVTDLNGDGQADLIWQNMATGYLAAWLMRGLTMVDGVYLSPAFVADTGWRIAGPR